MVTMNCAAFRVPRRRLAFGHGLQQAARRTGTRRRPGSDAARETAARAERQPLDVLPLRDDRADRIGRGAGLGVGVADREIADAQRGGQIPLEQHRRRRERRRDVVEAEVAAVARQQLGDVDVTPSRSRTALAYSVRFRRWSTKRPG